MNKQQMKLVEREKLRKVIQKIELGNFDENDIDNLFMKLRAYSTDSVIFREIADFVAHNDARDRGLVNEALEHMYLNFKFFHDYRMDKLPLNIQTTFPSWIIKLIKYQLTRIDDSILREKFNVTRERLLARIDNAYKIDNKAKTATYKEGKLSINTFQALSYCLSFIEFGQKFTQTQLIDELVKVLKSNMIDFNENILRSYSNQITICTLLLFQHSTYKLKDYELGKCEISTDNSTRQTHPHFEIENKKSFGNLCISATVSLLKEEGVGPAIGFNVITTNLPPEEWCDPSLLEVIEEKPDGWKYETYNLKGNLTLDENFRLRSA